MANIDFTKKVVVMEKITKKFGDFTANHELDLTVHRGEVHALLGENGAGKTTLMKALYGLHLPTAGSISINGKKLTISNPNIAIQHGIGMVHQHFMLVKPFTVTENIILGMEPTIGKTKIDIRKWAGILNMKKAVANVKNISTQYGLKVDPLARVQDISVGMEQRVEILKALYRGAEILILDEPTAVLTPQEILDLINIMKNLTEKGKTIIIITHKLKEIKDCADYCTIIRRGQLIDTVKVAEVTEHDLASKMVGREVSFKVEKKKKNKGKAIFKIDNLFVDDSRGLSAIDGLNLEVHSGEIMGIAGVDGNGQSELIEALTGIRKVKSGSISIHGENLANKTPRYVLDNHIATIHEDRQKRGLVADFTVAENMIIENYKKPPFSKKGILNLFNIVKHAKNLIKRFDVRPDDESYKAGELSGGNQQKMIIAREVTNDPELLIAAQPTRGLDVGAIEYVHKSLVQQRDNDKAVLLISFDLDEIMNVSDRIAVIFEGKIIGIMDADDADENEIGLMMAGEAHGKK